MDVDGNPWFLSAVKTRQFSFVSLGTWHRTTKPTFSKIAPSGRGMRNVGVGYHSPLLVSVFCRDTMYHMQKWVRWVKLRSRWWLSIFMGWAVV